MNEDNCYSYQGKITIVSNSSQLKAAVEILKDEPFLGFDVESKPNFRKNECHPPALLQLASQREVFLFQLQQLTSVNLLLNILSTEKIIKAGVNISQDIAHLQKVYSFQPSGFVELALLAKECGFEKSGLKTLFLEVFGKKIPSRACLSDWEKAHLSSAQINYAATDAWSALLLYRFFINLKKTPRH